jgi:sporulation protein YlmC with PRC-barrel domain
MRRQARSSAARWSTRAATRWAISTISSASALLQKEVIDRLHRDFGEIRDLRVDLAEKRVAAALVDRRDDWTPGEALVAVPIEAFSLLRDLPDKVAINYSRERFE